MKGRYVRLDSEKVRWHRDRLGWTLDTLAEQAEVAEGTALRAEHGEDIRPSSGRRIARAFGVDISELVPEKPGVMLPKAQPPPPEEVAAAAQQIAEETAGAAAGVAEQAAAAAIEATEGTAAPVDDEDVNVVHLESADDIGRYIDEILWNLPESTDRRLVVNIYKDNSAEIHIMPVEPAGERRTRKKRAEK